MPTWIEASAKCLMVLGGLGMLGAFQDRLWGLGALSMILGGLVLFALGEVCARIELHSLQQQAMIRWARGDSKQP